MTDRRGEPIEVVVESYLEDLVPSYLEHRHEDVAAIRSALEAGDLERARSLGHQMKGSGGGYGFDRVSDIGAAIEAASKRGDADGVGTQTDALADYLDRLVVRFE